MSAVWVFPDSIVEGIRRADEHGGAAASRAGMGGDDAVEAVVAYDQARWQARVVRDNETPLNRPRSAETSRSPRLDQGGQPAQSKFQSWEELAEACVMGQGRYPEVVRSE